MVKSALVLVELKEEDLANVEEWSFPPGNSSCLTEGDVFLSAGNKR